MRVALACQYPRDPAVIRGGVEAVTLRLSEGLAETPGVDEVHVVVAEPGRPVEVMRPRPNLTIHSIGGSRRFGNVLFSLPDRRRIARTLREIAPDVVHAHSAHREALGALESGLPTVVTIHGLLDIEIGLERALKRRFRNQFRRRLVESALRRMTAAILLGPTVAEHYRETLAHARTWVIENPVADRFFRSSEPTEPGTLLFSGVLIPRKGLRNLLAAVDLARRDVPGLRLRLAGMATHPDYKAELHRMVEERGLEPHVSFLGGLSSDELAREVARAAAFVLVSKQETLPVAIQEAMASGKPVIASPVGGVPSMVVEGETGLLVAHGDPARLAGCIRKLLSDDAFRERLGRRARQVAEERFTLTSVCRRTVEVYREVIERHPGRG